MPPPHDTAHHPICGDCFDSRHPGTEPHLAPSSDAKRCEWCGHYTSMGIVEEAPVEEVPAHIKAAEMAALVKEEQSGG